jgi:hypothetical protein
MRIAGMVWVALLFCAVNLDSQDTAQAGNQIFRIPAGWSRADSGVTTILSPNDQPPNMVVLMLAGRPLTGDFRATFDRDVNMNGTARVLTGGQVQSRHTPEGVDLLATTAEVQASNGSKSWRYIMAASVRGRFEIFVFMAPNQALFQRYWPAVQQFVPNWTFANLRDGAAAPADPGAAAVPPPPPPADPGANGGAAMPSSNRLEGIYMGYKYNYVTVLGVVQKKAVFDYFSFFADGTVYQGLPQTGLAGFNMQRECARNPIPCGVYQMNGDQVMIATNRGTYRQAGVRSAGGLRIGDRPYTLQGDISRLGQQAIEGVWGRADARPGEDLARKFIRFTGNGQFVDQGLVTTVCTADISTGNLRFERPGGQGTYRLAPYTVILRYSDGYQRQMTITVEPADMNNPAPPKVFVNTYTLVRR